MKELNAPQCLEYFADLLTLLATNRHYERVFHYVVDRIVRLYHCRTCAVVLIDRETEFLNIENCFGISRSYCKEFRKHLATGAIGDVLWTGRPLLISDASLLPALADEVYLEQPFASCIVVQISVHHQTLGYLYAASDAKDVFQTSDLPVIEMFARVAGIALYQNRLYDENIRLDRTDHETGLERYSCFAETMQQQLARAAETGEEFGLILMDVDNYKSIASTYGGEARRGFLREFGGLLVKHLRVYDRACRYGSDEVLIMLPNSGIDAVLHSGEHLCAVVREHTCTEHDIKSTVSAGAVVYPIDGTTVEELLLAVRQLVFDAQRSGRNRLLWRGETKNDIVIGN
jgi:diguanylate cyclase (GGDEF)-like protein